MRIGLADATKLITTASWLAVLAILLIVARRRPVSIKLEAQEAHFALNRNQNFLNDVQRNFGSIVDSVFNGALQKVADIIKVAANGRIRRASQFLYGGVPLDHRGYFRKCLLLLCRRGCFHGRCGLRCLKSLDSQDRPDQD